MRVACIQMTATESVDENIALARDGIAKAATAGARLITTPEMTGLLTRDKRLLVRTIVPEAEDSVIAALSETARDLKVWVLIGSTPIAAGVDVKAANRSILIAPDGRTAARYDKIHMFDVSLPDGQRYTESSTYRPGTSLVLADVDGTTLGMTVCYDMRFPRLYRQLAQAGAQIITVPSAFTHVTGEAHWHVLLRARAIETGCFVVAAAQTGEHVCGRRTYGHSLIVDPWGAVLADAGTAPGVITADLDLAAVERARTAVPSLGNDAAFHWPSDPAAAAE